MMKPSWIIRTNGDPLATVRHFLQDLWSSADFEGMLVQLDPIAETRPRPTFVEDPAHLLTANPFLPVVTLNAANLVSQIASHSPQARNAAVLRSCEARALFEMVKNNGISIDHWLIIVVDCPGSFPIDDYPWRLQRAGTTERLTHEVLRFARQGGIASYRFRSACQMCTSPGAERADVCICLFGLPIKEYILVATKDEAIAYKLHLGEITDQRATPEYMARHMETLHILNERHTHLHEQAIHKITADFPSDVDSWLSHLEDCAPCQACLEVCPLFAGSLSAPRAELVRWLSSCVECGMCEEACPKHLPLSAIIGRVKRDALHEALMISGSYY